MPTAAHHHRRFHAALAAAWTVALVTGMAGADPSPPESADDGPAADAASRHALSETYRDAMRKMRSSSYADREEATRTLLADTDLTLERIDQLRTVATTPEQQQRLSRLAEHHLIREMWQSARIDNQPPHLGICVEAVLPEMDHRLATPAVHVRAVMIGFPANGLIEPGDLIVAMDGRPIAHHGSPIKTAAAFEQKVQEKRVGQLIRLKVLRDAGSHTVRYRLPSKTAVQIFFNPSTGDMHPNTQALRDLLGMRDRLMEMVEPAAVLRSPFDPGDLDPPAPPAALKSSADDDAATEPEPAPQADHRDSRSSTGR